jgi:hypothetical protein
MRDGANAKLLAGHHAGMRACVRAERLGGENAKLLALWHVGMLGLKG